VPSLSVILLFLEVYTFKLYHNVYESNSDSNDFMDKKGGAQCSPNIALVIVVFDLDDDLEVSYNVIGVMYYLLPYAFL